jgi:serine/threonine-protein kinase RsbW
MDRKTLIIPSEHRHLEVVLEFIEQFATENDLDPELLDKLMLLGSEATTNAIEHGNDLDVGKQVTLHLSRRSRKIEMSVQDEGTGFKEEVIPDPLAEENLLKDGGRGLFLINALADEVHIEDQGRCIRMIFDAGA